ASSRCVSTMRPTSHTSAGAMSSSSANRVRGAARSAAVSVAMTARAKADGALRVEAEDHGLVDLEIRETSRLRQRDTDLGARRDLAHEHRRVGAIEQEAQDASGELLCGVRKLGPI